MELGEDALEFEFVNMPSQLENNLKDKAVYEQELKNKLHPGSCIFIKGSARLYCKRFAVNLIWSRGIKTDIAFHFNPRFALRYIVRNSLINSSWGDEETTSIEKFHLNRGKPFLLQILATEEEFMVAIDGRHICGYVFRMALEKVNKIKVEGAVHIKDINVGNIDMYPAPSADIPLIVPVIGQDENLPPEKLVVPVTAHLYNGLKTGWQLEISGRVKILPSSFYVNLQVGGGLWPHPMIPLHLNPRFFTSYGNHLFIRNSWMNGEWGVEERSPGVQLMPGKPFRLVIRRNEGNFGVWVDGQLCGEFDFRTPVDTIDTLYIHGDLKVDDVFLRDGTT